jgi:hypothetical protein
LTALATVIWGSDDCLWVYLPSRGNSGGILSIWRASTASLVFSFTGDGFVGVSLDWGIHKKRCFVVNIYSKCDLNSKRNLWSDLLMSKTGFGNGEWCLIGDFNAVLHRGERKGLNHSDPYVYSVELAEFREFVSRMDLIDVPVLGRKFTWFHPNGVTMSRIDRALVSEDWLRSWNNPSLWILPRTVSDHCPTVLRFNCFN